MAEQDPPQAPRPAASRVSRRAVLGGTLAAGSVAVAYAALGDKLGLFTGGDGAPAAAVGNADAIKQESVRISHLLRRAGFGLSQEEHARYQSMGLKATLDEVIDYPSVDDSAAEDIAAQFSVDQTARGVAPVWWLSRMANTKRPLQEKMTLFWHGLLTSQISEVKDPVAMVAQNQFFRDHAMDRFPDILRGVTQDPAMMVYLDIAGSDRRAPNENYARELMELFALGVGNYSEGDVREAARAFTGWSVPRTRADAVGFTLGTPVFRPERFDNGSKTFLGQTGNFRPDDIISIVTKQAASPSYIVRRLFSFFVFPEPSDADIAPFVAVYKDSDMRIGAVVEAILRSDVFYSPRVYRAIVKSPIEYAIGAVKALDLQGSVSQLTTAGRGGGGQLASMGQVPFEPPNVAGWPGGASWLNSATIFARLNFLNAITGGAALSQQPNRQQAGQQPARQRPQPTATPAMSQTAGDLGTAEQALSHYLPFVLDDNIADEARQVILDFAGGPTAALPADKLRGLVYLVLGSPQFHIS